MIWQNLELNNGDFVITSCQLNGIKIFDITININDDPLRLIVEIYPPSGRVDIIHDAPSYVNQNAVFIANEPFIRFCIEAYLDVLKGTTYEDCWKIFPNCKNSDIIHTLVKLL